MSCPIKLTIPSDSKYLCLARNTLKMFLDCHKIPEDVACKLMLCLDEACSNVIKYGYEGKSGQPIELSFEWEDGSLVVKIRDYGKQCDTQKIKPRPLSDVKPGGLGTHFIFEIMDSVDYCTQFEKGTLLTLCKKLDLQSKPVS